MRRRAIYRNRRQRKPSRTEGAFFKKEGSESFFGNNEHSAFFHPANQSLPTGIQRKCEDCEKEDKKVQRQTEKKEEEKLMRATDKKEEEKKLQREPEKKEEEKKLQKKEGAASSPPGKTVGGYVNSLGGKGQPLPATANQFFSARMGYDFSHVKLHTDKEAAESAKEINAKAYTTGNNIVFNEGQYNMESGEGQRLMAHELTHVIQQSGEENAEKLSRQITYPAATFSATNAISQILGGVRLALTTPTINGTPIPDDLAAAREIILTAFNLKGHGATVKTKDKSAICTYNEPTVKISANIALLQAPTNDKWTGQVLGSNYATQLSSCRGKGNIPLEATGNRTATDIYNKAKANEVEHYNDLKTLSTQHLGGLLTFLKNFQGVGATTDAECQKQFETYINGQDTATIDAFLTALSAKVAARDVVPGSHHFINDFHFAADCSKLNIVVHQ